jgi:hypothetical protein
MIDYDYDPHNEQAIMTLREEMAKIDEIMLAGSKNPSNPSVERALNDIYDKIKEKYGLKTGASNFRDFIRGVVDETRVEHTVNLAIESKIVMSLATRMKTEMMIAMTELLERAIELIKQQAFTTECLTPELVGMIDKLGTWMLKIDELRDKVKIADPSKAIDRAIDADKRENPEKYSDPSLSEDTSGDSNKLAMLRVMLASMNEADKK